MIRAIGVLALVLLTTGVVGANEADPPCVSQTFEGSPFTVCAFDKHKQDLRIVWADSHGSALRSFLALKQNLGGDARVRFAMNAGMFDDTGAPVGLFVANGRQERRLQTGSGNGNFFLKPNGVFLIDAGGAHVETTDFYARRAARTVTATQSGPMLVIGGALNTAFQADGPSRFVRNGVGVRDASHALFAISEEPVSFGKFARFFRDGLQCQNALYFDGAVSSLWVPRQGRMDSAHPLGPIIVVEDKVPAN
jgi:uncharacterized protein YigE (DUF2233 family)